MQFYLFLSLSVAVRGKVRVAVQEREEAASSDSPALARTICPEYCELYGTRYIGPRTRARGREAVGREVGLRRRAPLSVLLATTMAVDKTTFALARMLSSELLTVQSAKTVRSLSPIPALLLGR